MIWYDIMPVLDCDLVTDLYVIKIQKLLCKYESV